MKFKRYLLKWGYPYLIGFDILIIMDLLLDTYDNIIVASFIISRSYFFLGILNMLKDVVIMGEKYNQKRNSWR